jgi:hypothetical protein
VRVVSNGNGSGAGSHYTQDSSAPGAGVVVAFGKPKSWSYRRQFAMHVDIDGAKVMKFMHEKHYAAHTS